MHDVSRAIGLLVAEISPIFDHLGNFGRDHRLPGAIVIFDSPQDIAREDMQHCFIEIVELFDSASLHEVAVQAVQSSRHFYIFNGTELSRTRLPERIDVDPQVLPEYPTEGFEDTAFKSRVVLLHEEILKACDSH